MNLAIADRIERLPRLFASMAAAIAVTVLLGWVSGVEVLKSVYPGMVAMKANTAIGILACAIALLIHQRWRGSLLASGLFAAALGAAVLVEYAAHVDLGIDQLLFREPPGAPGGLPPGRLSINSAVCLLLLGTAMALLEVERLRSWVQGCALASFAVAFLSLLGQTYGGSGQVGWGVLDRMALNTSVALQSLAIAVLCARARSGWMAVMASSGAGGHMMRTLLPIVVLAPAVLGWLRVEGQELGLYELAFGSALLATVSIALFSTLVVWNARVAERIDGVRRRTEHWLQYQIEQMPMGYIVWGADFRVQAWNPAAAAIFGYSAEQAVGRHATELLLPESARAQVDEVWQRLVAAGQTVRSVNANRTRDGREIVCDWTNAPLQEDGRVVSVLSMVQDVTEQQRAAAALARSQALLAQTQRISRVGGWEYDVASRRVSWTEETYRLHAVEPGYDPSDAARQMAFYPDSDRRLLQQAFDDALQTGEPYELELQFTNARGEAMWVRTTGQAEMRDGRVVRLFGNLMDVTARKEADLAQRRYADRLRVVNRIDRMISSTFDLAAIYETLVEEMKRLFLFDRTSLVLLSDDARQWRIVRQWTRSDSALAAGVWFDVNGSGLAHLVATGQTLFEREIGDSWSETASLRREGLHSRMLAPLVFQGRVLGALSLSATVPGAYGAEDASILEALAAQIAIALNNARAYDALQQQATTLERRVRERTQQLESAVKDLEGFSYSVSHDLRAPLRAIDSFSDIILQDYADRLDDEGKRLFGIVRDNTAKMGRLIDDILAFSRAGRRELALAEVDMHALFAEVIDELRPTAGDRRIDFRLADLPAAQADRAALRQVTVNLVSNAIKFTRKRESAVVTIRCVEQDDQLIFSVADNGAGFDPKYAPKLFGVFQRLHSAEEFEGTGIGLAIVKRIVEKHGGRVWAEGEPDHGATFHFSLPRHLPGADTGAAP